MSGLKFELVAPEKLLVSRAVGMVTVPGEEGDFGVLPGHAPLISTLRTGVVDVSDEGKVSERYFVAGGFAEVSPDRCTVLAEEAVALADLKKADIEAQIKRWQDELSVATEADKATLQKKISINEAKLAWAA